MNSKEIIKLNNEMREQLTDKNKKIYEDMLVYIRLNNKSEQHTEEVLFEILEHLIKAQEEGKTAKEVFGHDLREYCDELIAEIPNEKRSLALQFGSYIIMFFLGILSTFHGISSYLLYTFFDVGSNDFTFSLGSGIVIVLIDLIILAVFIYVVLKWMKKSTFKEKKSKSWIEFLQLWLISMLFISLSIITPIFMPNFGTQITIPVISFAVIGLILFVISYIINKKYRITK